MAYKQKKWEGWKSLTKDTSGAPVEKCPKGKIWCKTVSKCLTQEACEDAMGLDTNIKTPKVHKDGKRVK